MISWRAARELGVSTKVSPHHVIWGAPPCPVEGTQWCDSFLKQVKVFDGEEKHSYQDVLNSILIYICFTCKHIKAWK